MNETIIAAIIGLVAALIGLIGTITAAIIQQDISVIRAIIGFIPIAISSVFAHSYVVATIVNKSLLTGLTILYFLIFVFLPMTVGVVILSNFKKAFGIWFIVGSMCLFGIALFANLEIGRYLPWILVPELSIGLLFLFL